MVLISLFYISYIIINKPFEERFTNRLEIFNETIILACYYHLLMFTGGITTDIMVVYDVGWSMDLLLLIQFSVNILCLGYSFALRVTAMLRRFKLKYEQNLMMVKEQELQMVADFERLKGRGLTAAQVNNEMRVTEIEDCGQRNERTIATLGKLGRGGNEFDQAQEHNKLIF